MGRSVVADAGPLIAFGRIGKLHLLTQVLGEVLVPQAVISECLADPEKPGARAIRDGIKARLLVKTSDPAIALPPLPVLDAGESAAIRRALDLSALILIDEKAGRKIAASLGLSVIGSAGVLLVAKKNGLIDLVKPMLDEFAGNGYHFSAALIAAILMRAGER